ncbi:MAG: aminotransferase class V-fold PLP-dependent enzyme [Candidatus Latescibacterota bacterium]
MSRKTGGVEPETVLNLIDSATLVLAMIHSSNNTGTKNDVATTIREARRIKPGLYVLVDGAQHLPHSRVDVERLGCDVYLTSSYKTFSKMGASGMFLSDRASRLPHDKLLGKPETYWELGTREQAGYAAWSAVVDYLCWLGGHFVQSSDRRAQIGAAMSAIESHERALTYRILHGAGDLRGMLDLDGITVYAEVADLTIKEPQLIFNVAGMASGDVVSHLGARGIRVHNRVSDAYSRHTLSALGLEECVRVSMAHYNTPEEVDAFLSILCGLT